MLSQASIPVPPSPSPSVRLTREQLTREADGLDAIVLDGDSKVIQGGTFKVPLLPSTTENMIRKHMEQKDNQSNYCRMFFEALKDCLESTAQTENIVVAISSFPNTFLSTVKYNDDPVSRLNVTVPTRTAMLMTCYAVMTVAHLLKERYGREQATEVTRAWLKRISLTAVAGNVVYSTACRLAAILFEWTGNVSDDDLNTGLAITSGVAIGVAFFTFMGSYLASGRPQQTQSSRWDYFNLFLLALTGANFAYQVERAYQYFPAGWTDEPRPVDWTYKVASSAVAFTGTLIATGVSWWKKKLNPTKALQVTAPVVNGIWDMGTAFQSFDYKQPLGYRIMLLASYLSQLVGPPTAHLSTSRSSFFKPKLNSPEHGVGPESKSEFEPEPTLPSPDA